MKEPLVSIIVPAHNAGSYLRQLCSSIQSQTYQNFEALIANDGSTDNTLDIVEAFRSDKRFRILSWPKNRGVSSATRSLFKIFKGQYWCHPGADDVLRPRFIEKRIELLERNPGAGMVHGNADYIDESGDPAPSDAVALNLPKQMTGERALSALLQHNFINTPSIMMRSSVTKRVIPFFTVHWKYAQDWFLWLLHFAAGSDLLWDPEPLHQYRIHSQSLSKSPSKVAIRHAEIRLVPLCGLSAAAKLSPIADALWSKWKRHLYVLWLRRALSLQKNRMLQHDWLQLGAEAFYGGEHHKASLTSEICRHGITLLQISRAEKKALASQRFRVSGVAQINDPIFQ